MRVADFIRGHRAAIVAEWEVFAALMQPAASRVTPPEFREHVGELLDAAAADLDNSQSPAEQEQKSFGLGSARRMTAAAQAHADRRIQAGFRLAQVLAEYRALRAIVARLWEDADPGPSAANRRELTRFHEMVDEALAECVSRYMAQLGHYRDQFLGVLGHDLRNPLAAISMSATMLSRSKELSEKHAGAARRIVSASERMSRLVSDLLDLTRTRLGEGIPLVKRPSNLGNVCRQVVDEMAVAHPGRQIFLRCTDSDLSGTWDSDRLAQIITNLVANAFQHGDGLRPVTIRATSTASNGILTVHNYGKAIPPSSLKTIFDPMVRSSDGRDDAGPAGNLGLGLFIVRELVTAHDGRVLVTSNGPGGTTFTVLLPRYENSHRKPADSTEDRRQTLPAGGPLAASDDGRTAQGMLRRGSRRNPRRVTPKPAWPKTSMPGT